MPLTNNYFALVDNVEKAIKRLNIQRHLTRKEREKIANDVQRLLTAYINVHD